MTKHDCIQPLVNAGIDREDAFALRRISMTLHRWHELECNGDVQRDESSGQTYAHYGHNTQGPFLTVKCADRETGALKRLAKIMARYPQFKPYIQGDPRGCALYILAHDQDENNYSRGMAVYK